jgi:2,3-bisphosphoglycerate-independent phosphoglycerate mutase
VSGPVVLVVLDGYGIGDAGPADATQVAHSPFLKEAARRYPLARIETSGESVGLPAGQMGNSEVGHMTMGAGRIVEADLTRITRTLRETPPEQHPAIRDLFAAVRRSGGTLHLVGLLSDGGVHSHIDHLVAIQDAAARQGIPTAVHAILDGRDTPPRSGREHLENLLERMPTDADAPVEAPVKAHIATVIGRYYAMDRDTRWDRIARAYHAIVCREGHSAPNAIQALDSAYAQDESDEFVAPYVIDGGRALEDGDAVFFLNFRADRARQLVNAITGAKLREFEGHLERKRVAKLAGCLCLCEYDVEFGLPVAFPVELPPQVLGEVIWRTGLAQLRVAETEKYAHVTFFFNGGREEPFPGEDHVLVPSPRDVTTYDHRPEMSADEVTRKLLERMQNGDYSFVLVNYANPDMVGHTGVMDAAVKAVEAVDRCLERVARAVLEHDGHLLITADHGNCERMLDPETGEPHTAHTTNPVPIHWISGDPGVRSLRDGGLADLAPTVLALMDLPIPEEMSGHSLIVQAP